MQVESPFNAQTGLIENWELTERLIDYAFTDRLGVRSSEHPLLMAEPSFNSRGNREKMTTLLFESFESPAIFLAKSPVLTAFANAKYTALVIECGAGGTCVTPVYDGYVLNRGIVRNLYGGDALSNNILNLLEKERGSAVKPNYMIRREKLTQDKFKVHEVNFANATESYRQYATMAVVNEIKESMFRVTETPFTEHENTPKMAFEMNDGVNVTLGAERYSFTETLFKPSSILAGSNQPVYQESNYNPSQIGVNDPVGELLENTTALQQLAYESIMRCDADVRKDLFANTILAGGTTLFNGLPKRMEKELIARAPANIRVKAPLAASQLPVERKFSTWIGGSILASLGTFQPMFISKKDFEEHGPSIIHKEAP